MILEHLMPGPKAFRPTSIEQYIAFQIARRFRDESRLRDYLLVAERHPTSKLIKAYSTARRVNNKRDRFFELLNH
jgi:hypothetical protein